MNLQFREPGLVAVGIVNTIGCFPVSVNLEKTLGLAGIILDLRDCKIGYFYFLIF